MTPELSRSVVISKIGMVGRVVEVRATPEECAALAARMDVPAILFLRCCFELKIADDGISVLAMGTLRSEVTRVCVASAEEFGSLVAEQFTVRFVPAGSESEDFSPDLPDEIPYTGTAIDLGEAAAEQLGLALDPYPKLAGTGGSMIENADDPSPFAVLARFSMSDQTKR